MAKKRARAGQPAEMLVFEFSDGLAVWPPFIFVEQGGYILIKNRILDRIRVKSRVLDDGQVEVPSGDDVLARIGPKVPKGFHKCKVEALLHGIRGKRCERILAFGSADPEIIIT